jgi:protein-disulfide isomerase
MDKRFWTIIGVIVLVFGGVLFLNSRTKDSSPITATNHVKGNADSKVSLVEYGDYQCPACSQFYSVTHEVQQKYGSTVKFQFRNLPLSSIHPNAFAAARAAEAADMQGKLWEMHDLLYENQDATGQSGWVISKDVLSNYFVNYAKQLDLDVTKFKADYASATVNSRINADMDAFKATGEEMSTPTFFLNGKKIDNSLLVDSSGLPSIDAFSKLLDEALGK